jgi:hypothetical protein
VIYTSSPHTMLHAIKPSSVNTDAFRLYLSHVSVWLSNYIGRH